MIQQTTYSLNELHSLIHKAAIGSGLPTGHAAAIAKAGIWLAQRQFPVCEIIARSLGHRHSNTDAARSPGRFDFQDARSAIDGIAAIDLLLAAPRDTKTVLHFLDEPALLLGLVGVATEHNANCITLLMEQGSIAVHGSYALSRTNTNTLATGNTISLTLSSVEPERQQSQRLSTRYDPSDNNDTGWNQLNALANKTYVPASDHSRIAGAGAGLTDND